jgi:hypothetical protein
MIADLNRRAVADDRNARDDRPPSSAGPFRGTAALCGARRRRGGRLASADDVD